MKLPTNISEADQLHAMAAKGKKSVKGILLTAAALGGAYGLMLTNPVTAGYAVLAGGASMLAVAKAGFKHIENQMIGRLADSQEFMAHGIIPAAIHRHSSIDATRKMTVACTTLGGACALVAVSAAALPVSALAGAMSIAALVMAKFGVDETRNAYRQLDSERYNQQPAVENDKPTFVMARPVRLAFQPRPTLIGQTLAV